MHRLRYHPYAVPDRRARFKAFDPVAYLMPLCVVDVFFPSSPTTSSEPFGASRANLTPGSSAPPTRANLVSSISREIDVTESGAMNYVRGTRPRVPNSLGLSFQSDNNASLSIQSVSSAARFIFASDDDDDGSHDDSSVPASPVSHLAPTLATALSPLIGLGNLPNFSRALRGQAPASSLDLRSLEEVMNELEPPAGGEAALVRSDSGLLLDFSLVMQRRWRPQDRPRDV
ncbi:unnamed protein product [Peniophora sp. CBMAI 1063]|nr:unnamed protein product [Peniophora sp. CBMAI 1063]